MSLLIMKCENDSTYAFEMLTLRSFIDFFLLFNNFHDDLQQCNLMLISLYSMCRIFLPICKSCVAHI
ncbi:hypothetical protein T08_5954 [Trichinella sp. T8]|nr:hypothetical protein T08_5954 [Trichinella sp. T8]